MAETTNHTITLTTTKEQLVECLDNLIHDMHDIYALLNNSPDKETGRNDMQVSIERLEQNRHNVSNLELRMCVVASMKAGKSTIINAILGQRILPSRNAAMTVLPTEIVLCVAKTNTEMSEPYLSLHSSLIEQLTNLLIAIRNHLNSTGITSEQLPQCLPSHPHLVKFAKEILINDVEFLERNEGTENICLALEKINDTIRLHEYLIPTEAFGLTKQLCFKLPRIYAPYVSAGSEALTNQSLGNLVIVDTPGPNESTATPFLKEIVQRELDKSFVILVVLDFTQFNTEADKAIKLEIDKIREVNHKSSDTLFALVNKVDQRRKEDMKKDQVHDFVKKMFSMDNEPSSIHDRIFEVTAFRALMAKQFFVELNRLPTQDNENHFDITTLSRIEDFLKEAFGTTYDEDDPPEKGKAIEAAKNMWKKSGFEVFLNGAIEKLIEKAAPHLLETALIRCRNDVHVLHENLVVREQLLDADEQKLHVEMKALQDDCNKLTSVMNEQMEQLEKEQKTMKELFADYFQKVAEEGQQQMDSIFDHVLNENSVQNKLSQSQEGRQEIANSVQALALTLATLLYQKARTAITGTINQLGVALRNVSIMLPTRNRLTFKNEEEAHQFLKNIEFIVSSIPEAAFVSLRKHVDEQCSYSRSRLNSHLQKNTDYILNMTQERFFKELNIDFPMPPMMLDLKYSDENVTCAEIELEKAYAPWWLLHLVNITHECGEQDDIYYHINTTNLKERCKRLLETSMKSIEENLHKYVDGELQQTFDLHFKNLDGNLKRYQNYVQQSLIDQKRSAEDKAEFKDKLIQQREHMKKYEKNLETISNNFYQRMNVDQNVAANN